MNKLDRILRPGSIAAVGGLQAAKVLEQCQKLGFEGDLWPIHPSKSEVAGLPAYPSIEALPGVPDATFIGVNRVLSIGIVESLEKINAGGAVCYASGYEELGEEGRHLQNQLVSAAKEMPIIGPNCYGMINYADGALLWPDQHGGQRLEAGQKGVAIITQSSNIAINFSMQQRGLPLAYLMTAGNQAQMGISEIAMGILQDPRVTALGLHIEGFDSAFAMEQLAATARELGKPIVVFKVGKSVYAQTATLSHTASLAGKFTTSTAFLKRNGFGQARSIGEFLETLKLLHCGGPLSGYELSSMSCSGGEASIVADASVGKKVNFRALTQQQKQSLENALGPMVTVSNPLDYHTYCWGKLDEMTAVYGAMVSAGFDLNLLIIDFPHPERCDDREWKEATACFVNALDAADARGALLVSMPENMSSDYADQYVRSGLVVLFGFDDALRACEIAADIQQAWKASAARPIVKLRQRMDSRTITVDEANAKGYLREAGVNVPGGGVVQSIEQALSLAQGIGFPVVLKVMGISHKTEFGAVRLNLRTSAELKASVIDLLPLGSSLYLEKMVESPVAELIVGITRDDQMGLQMTIGCGGVLVEILGDSATLLLPTDRETVEAALMGLQLAPLLLGYRGKPKADVEAALDAVMAIQAFALSETERLCELDVNPLIVCDQGKGAFAADALLVFLEDKDCD